MTGTTPFGPIFAAAKAGMPLSDRKPWFLAMKPEDANRQGSQRMRAGAASRGKVVARPIAPEGWIALLAFVAILVAAPLVILQWTISSGGLSLPGAVVLTLIVEAIAIAAFVLLVRARMTRPPPS